MADVKVSALSYTTRPADLRVKSISVYEGGSDRLVATIPYPRPTPGADEYSKHFRFALPADKVDPDKQYTFVANATIDDADAPLVRSSYTSAEELGPWSWVGPDEPTLESVFTQMDADRDGQITYRELTRMARAAGAPTLWAAGGFGPVDLFDALDSNKDDRVEMPELIQDLRNLFGVAPRASSESNEEAIQRIRGSMDRFMLEAGGSTTGPLTKDAVGAYLAKVISATEGPEEAEGLAQMGLWLFDGDNDGQISSGELFEVFRQLGGLP